MDEEEKTKDKDKEGDDKDEGVYILFHEFVGSEKVRVDCEVSSVET